MEDDPRNRIAREDLRLPGSETKVYTFDAFPEQYQLDCHFHHEKARIDWTSDDKRKKGSRYLRRDMYLYGSTAGGDKGQVVFRSPQEFKPTPYGCSM